MTSSDIDRAKQDAREKVWDRLANYGAAVPPGAHGRIPDFVGANLAAQRLAGLETWSSANVVKANPDWAQLPVRVMALRAGKLVYMAVPRMATLRPFYLLDPGALAGPIDEMATGDGAAKAAHTVGVDDMRPVDLIVCGSVAVNPAGVRVGKGAGYSDIEVALLIEAGLVGPSTIIATTVHALQVVEDDLPETEHDFSVDLIVTPDETIHCEPPRRPNGIVWEHLDAEKIAAIPALARLKLSLPDTSPDSHTLPGRQYLS